MKLDPAPVIGTVKVLSLSVLGTLVTVSVAFKVSGHWAGAVPPWFGNQVQASWGAKDTVIVQDCPGTRLKADPAGVAQLSDSVKFGRLVKSVWPMSELLPDVAAQFNFRPFR